MEGGAVSAAAGVGGGVGLETIRQTMQAHAASVLQVQTELTDEQIENGAATERVARLKTETEAVLAMLEAALGGGVIAAPELEPAAQAPAPQPTVAAVNLLPPPMLQPGMMGATVAAVLTNSSLGMNPKHVRGDSGGSSTFWSGLTRSGGSSGASDSQNAAISRLQEGKSALQKSTVELSEALARTEVRFSIDFRLLLGCSLAEPGLFWRIGSQRLAPEGAGGHQRAAEEFRASPKLAAGDCVLDWWE